MRRRKGRAPTEEELSLWRGVARTLRTKPPEPAPEPATHPEIAPKSRPLMSSTADIRLKPVGRPEPLIRTPASPTPAPSGLDRRTEERLRKGRRDPDARIDLHGMTAARAHGALTRFIGDARRQGHRCVLVITGKGAPGPSQGFGDWTPGVLRRETPIWLKTPPLAQQIVHVSQAHPKHGGGGALYVYLKKRG